VAVEGDVFVAHSDQCVAPAHLRPPLCLLLQDDSAHDLGSELHSSEDAGHQGRTESAQGAGLLCPCEAPAQG
jgi:hypothetical protein